MTTKDTRSDLSISNQDNDLNSLDHEGEQELHHNKKNSNEIFEVYNNDFSNLVENSCNINN